MLRLHALTAGLILLKFGIDVDVTLEMDIQFWVEAKKAANTM